MHQTIFLIEFFSLVVGYFRQGSLISIKQQLQIQNYPKDINTDAYSFINRKESLLKYEDFQCQFDYDLIYSPGYWKINNRQFLFSGIVYLVKIYNFFVICQLTIQMESEKQLLKYYQQKVDELYRQRLSWLSKFQQCATQLQQKQELMNKLKDHKDKQADLKRNIIHHDIALIDQKINSIKMERQNIFNQYQDAEQILKIQELMEEYPQEIQKHLPCAIISNNAGTIQNQLNIHNAGKSIRNNTKQNANIFREQNSVLNHQKYGKGSKLKYKPTYEQLLKREIAELKANQDKQAVLMQEQIDKLTKIIKDVKRDEEKQLNDERDVLNDLKKQVTKQQKRHQELAQKYFDARKKIKNQHEQTLSENSRLKQTVKQLQLRVSEQMRLYEKQNKAKQTLIMRKSDDFKEDYKARMRAKQHNLQALKDNYEKMQQVCIQKVQRLQQTVKAARQKLDQTQKSRERIVAVLRGQLYDLQRSQKQQRLQRAKVELQMKQKVETEKRKREQLKQKAQNEQKRYKKSQLIQQAYKTTIKAKSKQKKRSSKKAKKPQQSLESQEQDEQSIDISQLENIKQEINRLDHIIQPSKKKK